MSEKSVEEMLNEIQEALIERTNRYAKEAETDIFSAMSLSMYVQCQKQFLDLITAYDSMKESVKYFHKFVLEDMEV